jgi:hypothetical protein
MSNLTVGSIGGLSVNSNIVSIPSGHQIAGTVFNNYPGAIIKTQHYNTGYGSGARTTTTSTSFVTAAIGGTGLTGDRNNSNNNILKYTKVYGDSQLMVKVSFPFYITPGSSGFGIRCQTTIGGNNYIVDPIDNGPAHGWGAGGYGGSTSGVFNFSWFTGDKSSVYNILDGYTGPIEFWFQVMSWTSSDTLFFIDYDNSYPKYGVIDIMEIAQ